jgi:hypothetical protein
MTAKWIALTPQDEKDGETVWVNFERASSIWGHKKGSRICFVADEREGAVDVKEAPQDILDRINE